MKQAMKLLIGLFLMLNMQMTETTGGSGNIFILMQFETPLVLSLWLQTLTQIESLKLSFNLCSVYEHVLQFCRILRLCCRKTLLLDLVYVLQGNILPQVDFLKFLENKKWSFLSAFSLANEKKKKKKKKKTRENSGFPLLY